MSGRRIRLLLGDDNSGVLEETRALLSSEFDVIATAADGIDLITAARTFRPDVIVTDISMPMLNGIEASRQILERGYCKKILILSVMNNSEIVKSAFEAGISGYVLKDRAGDELIDAIRLAVSDKVFLSSAIRDRENYR